MKAGTITPANLGPANVARLRTHPNRQVARRGRGAARHAQPGGEGEERHHRGADAGGREAGRCGQGQGRSSPAPARRCHKLGDVGKSEVGPPLNGMGAHGRAALLAHIIDPNREVDPSFWQWNVTTKKGETLRGRDRQRERRRASRCATRTATSRSRRTTSPRARTRGRSLMPEGLEALGAEALRDILTFIAGDGDQKFRVVDLRDAYTADSRRGLRREDERDETVDAAPVRRRDGRRRAVLRDGSGAVAERDEPRRAQGRTGHARTSPRSCRSRVEIPTSVTAASLHFLGGVGGWAWPTGGDARARHAGDEGRSSSSPTARARSTCSRTASTSPTRSAAPTCRSAPTPAISRAAASCATSRSNLGKKAPLSKIVLESFDNDIVPATVAITAGAEPARQAPLPAARRRVRRRRAGASAAQARRKAARATRRCRRRSRSSGRRARRRCSSSAAAARTTSASSSARPTAPRSAAAGFSVNYTEDRDQAAAEIGNADVAVISVNRQFFDTPEYRKALVRFRGRRQGPRHAAPRHVVRVRAVAGAERDDRRRRRARSRSHREVLGQRGASRSIRS